MRTEISKMVAWPAFEQTIRTGTGSSFARARPHRAFTKGHPFQYRVNGAAWKTKSCQFGTMFTEPTQRALSLMTPSGNAPASPPSDRIDLVKDNLGHIIELCVAIAF